VSKIDGKRFLYVFWDFNFLDGKCNTILELKLKTQRSTSKQGNRDA